MSRLRAFSSALYMTCMIFCVVGAAFATSISSYDYEGLEPVTVGSGPRMLNSSTPAAPEPLSQSAVVLDVPAAEWYYGCSPTAAGMLFGYYESWGGPGGNYTNIFDGTLSDPFDSSDDDYSLIATQDHQDDYYTGSGATGDPWAGDGEDNWEGCTADFMGTNQWKWDYSSYPDTDEDIDRNADDSTTFWYDPGGGPAYDFQPGAQYGTPDTSGCHGMRMFVESRGYSVHYDASVGDYRNFNQYVDPYVPGGFTYGDYKAEIDSLRPVLIQIEGHTMTGIGYDDAGSTQDVIVYDTWDTSQHTMTWGDSYSGRQHQGVTVVQMEPVPEPTTLAMIAAGIVVLAMWISKERMTA